MTPDSKKKILLIEDNPETQLIFKVFLRDYYDMEAAETAEDGIALLNTNKYDLLLLDINLPGELDGNDVLHHVRVEKEDIEFPIIVVTAYAMKGDKEKFIAAGADDYLSKPIDKDALLSKISKLISR